MGADFSKCTCFESTPLYCEASSHKCVCCFDTNTNDAFFLCLAQKHKCRCFMNSLFCASKIHDCICHLSIDTNVCQSKIHSNKQLQFYK